jgi:RNA polymerase sigma factor (TIGR02999 family)
VYEELRQIAARYLRDESRPQTLQATALVHEAYLRLVGTNETPWQSRAHFFGAAAQAIRRILTEQARRRGRIKRGGGLEREEMDESPIVALPTDVDLDGLDIALTELSKLDPQKVKVVELRFFAGLTKEQTALALGISPSTVARDWQFARVWLNQRLRDRE